MNSILTKAVIAIVALVCFNNCQGDESLKVGGYEQWTANGSPRPYDVYFEFASPLKPLEPTEVTITLKAMPFPMPAAPEFEEARLTSDWTFAVHHNNAMSTILGDTVLVWPGPRKIGDTYTWTITVVPLASGPGAIGLSPGGCRVEWCIDADGTFLGLSHPERPTESPVARNCDVMRCAFFNDDSLYFRAPAEIHPSGLFTYDVTVKPLPRIGDTSVVHCYLTATRDFPSGVDYIISYNRMELPSHTGALSKPLIKGESIDFAFTVVPDDCRCGQNLTVDFIEEIAAKSYLVSSMTTISCGLIFDGDSTLAFAGPNIDRCRPEYLSPLLPEKTPGDYVGGRITVLRTGEQISGD